MKSPNRNAGYLGFTLIEFVMTVALIAVLGTLSVSIITGNADSERYEQTRTKMNAIRVGILGDDSIDNQGHRIRYGYVGDLGGLPVTLDSLTTRGSQPSWSFDTAEGIGGGWRGPYVSERDQGFEGITKDGWGNTFSWSTSATPPSLTSTGSDGAVGGTLYAKDLAMTFDTFTRLAKVEGFVMDGTIAMATQTVELRYPVNGVLTAASNVTDASGYFNFSNVPFGLASARVTGTFARGPVRVHVDTPRVVVAQDSFNYLQSAYTVSYSAGSIAVSGAGPHIVDVNLVNGYPVAKTVDFATVYWDRSGTATEGFLCEVTLNGTSESFTNTPPGTRIDITAALTISASSTQNFRLTFGADSACASTAIDMRLTAYTVLLEWTTSTGVHDTVSFVAP